MVQMQVNIEALNIGFNSDYNVIQAYQTFYTYYTSGPELESAVYWETAKDFKETAQNFWGLQEIFVPYWTPYCLACIFFDICSVHPFRDLIQKVRIGNRQVEILI